jgi:methylthioribose-1-phosphate isomerase
MKNFESLSLKLKNNRLHVIDQTRLPADEVWLEISDVDRLVEAIQSLRVRGAPLIGVVAASFLELEREKGKSASAFNEMAARIRKSRPTAVNLMNAIDRVLRGESGEDILEEDVELCNKMGAIGAELIQDGDNILTHCNTGSLATAGSGTALAAIKSAFAQGKKIHVFVDETRPLLQGGRLTAWELERVGIPYTLICDNMAGSLMQKGRIDKIFVGSDRIALNGDFANKIGTYSVAVLALFHKIPFYPVAPLTTLDVKSQKGAEIEIEMRNPNEVRGAMGSFGTVTWAPKDSPAYNPSFDVTPVDLVTGLVMDCGYFSQQELLKGCLQSLISLK